MHARIRLALVSLALSTAVGLAGCDSIDRFSDTMTGLFDTKKRLPGERKPVFPEGVPGVTPGVPAEYIKRAPEQAPAPEATREAAATEGDTAPEKKRSEPQAEKKENPVRKRPRPQTAETPERPAAATPVPAQPLRAAPSPATGTQTAAPQAAPSSPWPAAPPAGTFSR